MTRFPVGAKVVVASFPAIPRANKNYTNRRGVVVETALIVGDAYRVVMVETTGPWLIDVKDLIEEDVYDSPLYRALL